MRDGDSRLGTDPPWSRDDPPVSVVLYRADDTWRHAIGTEKGGILDGWLSGLPASAPVKDAQARVDKLIADLGREFHGLELLIEWSPSEKPGWWEGEVHRR